MPQGLSAVPPTANQSRPGGSRTQRRHAACLSTRKRASKKTPRPAANSASPVRRRSNRGSTANSY
jgi:hypothetical protein